MNEKTNINHHHHLAIYLIINGPLDMSAGKIAAQAFQACQRMMKMRDEGKCTPDQLRALEQWEQDGTRTICRIAETTHIFDRACHELEGVLMIDEGMTEVPADSPTIFATFPMYRGSHSLLAHKRIPLLVAPLDRADSAFRPEPISVA